MSFKVGDRVVCINDENILNPHMIANGKLKKGEIYTIRKCFTGAKGNVCVYLEEIICEPHPKDGEYGFLAWRFEKAIDNFATEII